MEPYEEKNFLEGFLINITFNWNNSLNLCH